MHNMLFSDVRYVSQANRIYHRARYQAYLPEQFFNWYGFDDF